MQSKIARSIFAVEGTSQKAQEAERSAKRSSHAQCIVVFPYVSSVFHHALCFGDAASVEHIWTASGEGQKTSGRAPISSPGKAHPMAEAQLYKGVG